MPHFIGPLAHTIHSTKPVSYEYATKWLSAYTARSQTHPHMHPDAQVSHRIDFGNNGATGGIVLAQMRKITAGLRGERLSPVREVESNDRVGGGINKRKREGAEDMEKQLAGAKGQTKKAKKGMQTTMDGTAESEWEDRGEWESKQGGEEGAAELGEVGERSNYVGQVDDAPDVEELPESEAREIEAEKAEEAALVGDVDKEERKRLKKEKRKAEKSEEAKRARKT